MDRGPTKEGRAPRIQPAKTWVRAVEGDWELDGKTIRICEDPTTGAFLAIEEGGGSFNPAQVISRGRRLPES